MRPGKTCTCRLTYVPARAESPSAPDFCTSVNSPFLLAGHRRTRPHGREARSEVPGGYGRFSSGNTMAMEYRLISSLAAVCHFWIPYATFALLCCIVGYTTKDGFLTLHGIW